MTRTVRPYHAHRPVLWLVGALLAGAGLLLTGCGGALDSANYRYLTIVLNVTDPDGFAVGGATVRVDGRVQAYTTGSTYTRLTDGPSEWYGWRYNFRRDDLPVKVSTYSSQETVVVRVSRTGYRDAETSFTVYDWDRTYLFGRATLIMQPLYQPWSEGQAAPEPLQFESEKLAAPRS